MSTSDESPKDIAARLAAAAAKDGVRFPKVWDEKQILQKCYATLSEMQFYIERCYTKSAQFIQFLRKFRKLKNRNI
jgi:hypothetical protein